MRVEKGHVVILDSTFCQECHFVDCVVDAEWSEDMQCLIVNCYWHRCHFNIKMEELVKISISNYCEDCTFA